MKKITNKFVKILMLVSMIFSSFQTPIQVFAKEIANRDSEIPVGSIKLGENGKIEESGIASTTVTKNGINVTKKVSKTDTLGKYHVKFELKGTKTEVNRPVYVVVVFDRSGSMIQNDKDKQDISKWNNAVEGAKSFANSILTNIPNAKLGLVTFAKEASLARGFENANFEDVNNESLFGSANGGTNLDAGLQRAQKLFQDTQIEEKALKYVVVMSDGEPTYYNGTCFGLFGKYTCTRGDGGSTDRDTLEATLKTADEVKKIATVYSIGYSLKSGNAYKGEYTYNGTTYDEDLTAADILTKVATPAEQDKKYYYSADDKEQIVKTFSDIANQIIKSGTNAQIIDKLGSNFKLVNDDNNNYGIEKASEVYEELSNDTITFEFDIEINPDASTGWHQTNDGFRLEYIDNNGVKQTINSEEDPYVYWKQKTYQYKVSYYKDSFENAPFETDTRYATNGTVINIDNVEKDKYLSEAGARYEFNRIYPASITITNDGEVKKIKVLYTAEGTVIARYKDTDGVVLAQEETTTGIVGTDYTTNSKNIYGYTLVSEPTNKNGVYTYNENNEPIYVDYIYTKNEGALEINDVIKTQINKITGANSTFKYILSYNGKLDNYVGVANLTLVDTLPYDVASIEYDESICSYDSATRKLTCNKKVEITKDNKDTILNTQIEVIVKYNKLTSTTDLEVKNIVDSKLVYGDKSALDNDDVIDTIKSSKVTAIYVDENDNTLASSEVSTGLIDNEYTTSEKTIYGYTLKEVPANKNGVYTEEEIIVKYVYTKNDGTVTKNEVVKTGPKNVNSIDGIFNYTLSYNGEIKDYKGIAKLTLVDYLPYELEDGSTYEGCTYDKTNNTLTCVKEFDITEENNKVEASFNLSLIFKNVDSDKITNKVKSTLEYGNNHNEDEDKTETEVFKGTVVARYLDEDNTTVLAPSESSTGLSGSEYTTSKKDIYGYTFKEVQGNENGKYAAKETIYVDYIYTKNDGTVTKNITTKDQINTILGSNSKFEYVLSYNGKIEGYVGEATIKLIDKLPYAVKEISYDENACTFDKDTNTLTCFETVMIDEENQEVNAKFRVIVKYLGLTSESDLTVKNKVDATLTYGDNKKTSDGETEDVVKSSKVTAIYVDENDNTLASSEVTTGLIDNEYTTSEKTIYGYTLKEVPANKNGVYTEEEIIVKYVYTKNDGTVTKNEVVKTGPKNVNSIDGIFNYTLSYNGEIKDYKGIAKLTLVDYLPYELEDGSTYEGCTYDKTNNTLTCVKEFDITEENNKVEASFNLSLIFKNVDSDKITNKVKSTLEYGNNHNEDEDKTETEVFKGTVVARYLDEDNTTVLAPSESSTGLGGSEYTTSEKTIYGYTLKEMPTNKNGKYAANETIYVDYIYAKNEGVLVENDVVKTQINKIVGANSTFKYILSYNGKLDDYVGKANLTLIDTLPYDVASIEYDESICSYDSTTRKLTCSKEVEITKDNKDTILNTQIEVIVKYNKLTSTTDLEVKNIVDSKLVYGDKSALDNDDVIDTIKSSKVVTIYVDEDDNELASSEEMTGLIDNEYTTEEKDILGYTLKEVPSNKDGLYTEEEIIVKYVYTKNIGTSEEEVKKVGLEEVASINDAFIYTITYNAVVKDYVGDVKLVITDKLPYEIDEEKSVIDTNNDNITCKYIDSKIVCEYNKTIDSEEDNTIEVVINLELYFKNVDNEMIVNKVEANLTYGDIHKISEDETGTKVLSGMVIVNYITEDGEELASSEEMTGLVGIEYKTTKKAFDKYYLKEVKGNETGVYAEDTQEVTYVYSLIPLPPQTGYEGNNTNYIGLFILGIVMLLFKKKI